MVMVGDVTVGAGTVTVAIVAFVRAVIFRGTAGENAPFSVQVWSTVRCPSSWSLAVFVEYLTMALETRQKKFAAA